MKIDGYTTSSKSVNNLIDKDGLDSFSIIKITTEHELSIGIYEYKTNFLNSIDDTEFKSNWLNISKNNRFDTTKKSNNPMHDIDIVEISIINRNKSNLEKYGVEYLLQIPEFKLKQQKTCETTVLERYGVENVFQLETTIQSSKSTLTQRYGYDSPAKFPKNRDKFIAKNNTLLKCEHCCEVVKYSTWLLHHGRYCKTNPNCELISKFAVYNIYTGESKVVSSKLEYDKNWINCAGKIYFVYDNNDILINKSSNLRNWCDKNCTTH